MKFSQLNDPQQRAVQAALETLLSTKAQEDHQLSMSGYRLLIIGNGAGVTLLAAFMSSIVGEPLFSSLLAPLAIFLAGLLVAALSYIPLVAVTNRSLIALWNEYNSIVRDQKELEDFKGYGFNALGKFIFFGLLAIALLCFLWGAIWVIVALASV